MQTILGGKLPINVGMVQKLNSLNSLAHQHQPTTIRCTVQHPMHIILFIFHRSHQHPIEIDIGIGIIIITSISMLHCTY
jgi:hypothetical protein